MSWRTGDGDVEHLPGDSLGHQSPPYILFCSISIFSEIMGGGGLKMTGLEEEEDVDGSSLLCQVALHWTCHWARGIAFGALLQASIDLKRVLSPIP